MLMEDVEIKVNLACWDPEPPPTNIQPEVFIGKLHILSIL